MTKFLTVFNLFASAASIAGFLVALQVQSANGLMIATFIVALLLALYVLLVPGNPLARNVAAKLELFRDTVSGDDIMVQRGTCDIHEMGPATVQFYQPFAIPPKVTVLHVGRKGGSLPSVSEVSNVHAEFTRFSYGDRTPNTFAWIAQGKPLQLVRGAQDTTHNS